MPPGRDATIERRGTRSRYRDVTPSRHGTLRRHVLDMVVTVRDVTRSQHGMHHGHIPGRDVVTSIDETGRDRVTSRRDRVTSASRPASATRRRGRSPLQKPARGRGRAEVPGDIPPITSLRRDVTVIAGRDCACSLGTAVSIRGFGRIPGRA